MSTKQFFLAFLPAVFAVIYLPAERACAQAQDGNFSKTPIQMVVNAGTNQERWATSQFGVMESVGLRQGEQIAIALVAPAGTKSRPVGLAPLDGGEIGVTQEPEVDGNGTVSFTFTGGNVPGIYRIVVTIGADQYLLQLYVAHPDDLPGPPCPP
jgi:hypothetical protein